VISPQAFDLSARLRSYAADVAIDMNGIFDPDGEAEASTEFAGFKNRGTPRDWLAAGAIREDDYRPHPFLESVFGCLPPLNPQSESERIDRPTNHFFDAQRGGAGLTLAGGLPAPDWALGLQGWGSNPDQNHFSLLDARIYQFRSLTESSRVERDRNTAFLFRTLGQVIHVLQDMAQPQHTRNDSHLGCTNALPQFVGGEKSWYEAYTETRALNVRYRSRSDASRPLVLSGYGPVGFPAYRDYWANTNGSGLAEFSSRNFFSAGTNLGTFYLTGPCGGLSQPVCDPQAYRTEDFDFTIPTVTGETLAGRVRFFLRDIADPLTGQVVQNVRVSSRSLWDQHLETNQRSPKFSLNTYNYDSIANVLLPRAVGYSAGLLDYFFRGKLDVDLDVDVNEGGQTQFMLTGANTTKDNALGPGTLALYRDTAPGERSSAISAPVSGTVQPGKDLFPAVPPPAFPAAADDGERPFMAVYTGTLGFEQPMGTSPGGVIGRLIPGIRAETIFPDGTIRNLRAVEGVFSLPPAVDGLDTIQWGDLDNSFVGLVSATPGTLAPDQVKVFTLNRAVGSPTVPLAGGTQVVDASLLKAINFPFGLGLPTTLDYALAHFGQGSLTIVEIKETLVFKSVIVDGVETGGYEAQPLVVTVSSEGGGGGLIEFAQRVPIVLDRAHLLGVDADPRPYGWRVVEVGLDAQQRPLALVEVQLTLPPEPVNQDFLAPAFDENGNRFVAPVVPVQGRFPIDILLWALIDVERGTVLGVTSEPTVSIRRVELHNTGRTFFHTTIEFLGGDNPPPKFEQWTSRADLTPFLDPRLLNNDFPTELLGATITESSQGVQTLSLDGWYRADLHSLVGPQIQTSATPFGESALTVAVDPVARKNLQVRLTGITVFSTNNYFTFIRQGMRMRPTPAGATPEVLLLFGIPTGVIIGEGEEAKLVAWSSQVAENTRLAFPDELPRSNYTLLGATPRAALVRAQDTLGRFTTFLFDLRKATSTLLASQDLGEQYVLLAPKFLYNIMDTKFHAPRADLSPTFLPRSLAPGPAIPAPQAAYHLIRVR